MSGFNKIVPEIIQSSIWNEASDIRIVWITIIAIKDAMGYVRGDASTLARMANVPLEITKLALEKFQSPDPSSHTPDNEGRRIEPAPGGWIVLNNELYRDGDRTEYMREYMRKRRSSPVNPVNVNTGLRSVSVSDSDSEKKGIVKGKADTANDRVAFDPESGRITGVLDEDIARLHDAYPAVDIRLAISAAGSWLLANPTKRKKNVWRFLTNWCSRNQERGGNTMQRPVDKKVRC